MKLVRRLLVSVAGLSCLGAVGCAANAPGGEEAGETTSSELGQGINVPNPSGAYFASIDANGSGCPAGTWSASISPDGQAFTVTFSAYEATVNPGQSFAIKDCTLSITLKTPEGFSFSVSSFYYQGYAILDQPGMSARQSAKYSFSGAAGGKEKRSDIAGPFNDSYLFGDEVGLSDLVWSPCGATRTLNAATRLVLTNNPQKTGSGYINNAADDGSIDTVMRFGLSWKQCGGPPPVQCVPSGFATLRQNCSADTGGCQYMPDSCSLGWCCR